MDSFWFVVWLKAVGTSALLLIGYMGFQAGRLRAKQADAQHRKTQKRIIAAVSLVGLLLIVGGIWLIPTTYHEAFIPTTPSTTHAFKRMRNDIEHVQTTLDSAFSALQSQALSQAIQLDEMNARVVAARKEAEQYRALASLSKEQQQAFLRTLEQRMPSNVVSFWLGVASSVLVAVVGFVLRKLLQKFGVIK